MSSVDSSTDDTQAFGPPWKLKAAPSSSGGGGGPMLATIYGGHYDRLNAIVAAARTGNAILLKLSIAHLDAYDVSNDCEWGQNSDELRNAD